MMNELIIDLRQSGYLYYKTEKATALEAFEEFRKKLEAAGVNDDNANYFSAVLRDSEGRDIDRCFKPASPRENTCIKYLYRDAANYKVWNEAVIPGKFTEAQKAAIRSSLIDGEYFYPSRVGLDEERFSDSYDDDPDWFELCEDNFALTDKAPTVRITPEELVQNFLRMSGKKGNT